jgi:hypothetical protein
MITPDRRTSNKHRPAMETMLRRRSTLPVRHALRAATPIAWGLVSLITLTEPLLADPFKATMGEMARTTKDAKVALAANDRATFDAILRAYADEAKAGMALFPGGSAKNQDLRARFSTFAATADATRQSGSNPARFRAAFSSLVGECRSCHAAYK